MVDATAERDDSQRYEVFWRDVAGFKVSEIVTATSRREAAQKIINKINKGIDEVIGPL